MTMQQSRTMNKYDQIKAHAKRRARQRYGIDLNDQVHQELVNMIQKQEAQLVDKQSNRVTVWDMTYKGDEMRVVYDTLRHLIVTFLYKDHDVWDLI